MNKIFKKLLKEMQEYGVGIEDSKIEFVERQLERAFIAGNIKGLEDAQKIYKK